jgi:hypothetical protein
MVFDEIDRMDEFFVNEEVRRAETQAQINNKGYLEIRDIRRDVRESALKSRGYTQSYLSALGAEPYNWQISIAQSAAYEAEGRAAFFSHNNMFSDPRALQKEKDEAKRKAYDREMRSMGFFEVWRKR